MRTRLVTVLLVWAVAACSTAASIAPSTAAPVTATPTPTPTPTAAPTASRAPSPPPGTTAWPKAFDVPMTGTYWSSPPFRIGFSIMLDEPGWVSGHLHEEFVDLQRFDGQAQHTFPNRMLGFGDPNTIRGDRGVAVETLTPGAALDLLAARGSLTSSDRTAVELFGLQGERIDLHSATNNNPIFGGDAGDFGLGPQLDVRLVLLPLDGRLLIVAVLAPPGEIEAAWDEVLPILETVELD